MDGVGVAEQVVEVAEDLLVGADQEDAEVVGLAVDGVQRQRALDVAAVDELVDLAVRVAGDVAEHRVVRRRRVQPVDRHHREQLLDRPAVRARLEQREVAEVGVGHRVVEALQILRHVVHLRDQLAQLDEDRPVEVLGLAALLERQVAAAEQVQRHVERLLRVVVALERVAGVDRFVVGLEQVDDRLLRFVRRDRLGDLLLAERRDAEHVEDQHAVVRDDGAAALRDDRRVRHAPRRRTPSGCGRRRRWRTPRACS